MKTIVVKTQKEFDKILSEIKNLVEKAKENLIRKDFEILGKLMNAHNNDF